MMDMRFLIVFILFSGFLDVLSGQEDGVLPVFEPGHVNDFKREDISYSSKCFEGAYQDQGGRLWLVPCGDEALINSISLYQFDGYRIVPVEIRDAENEIIESPSIMGIYKGRYLLLRARSGNLVLFETNNRKTHTVRTSDPAFAELTVWGVTAHDTSAFVLGSTTEEPLIILSLQDTIMNVDHILDPGKGGYRVPGYASMSVSDEEAWIIRGNFPVLRLDRSSGLVTSYGLEDFPGLSQKFLGDEYHMGQVPVPALNYQGEPYIWFREGSGNTLFHYDRENDRFENMRDCIPDGFQPEGLYTDVSGNTCFMFRDKSDQVRSVLEDVAGNRYDYTPVLNSAKREITSLGSQDFSKLAYLFTNEGFYIAGVRDGKMIQQALPGKWISSMIELPDGRLLVNTVDEGWFVYDEKIGITQSFEGPQCNPGQSAFGLGMKEQIIPDEEGNFWFISRKFLVRYDPLEDSCQYFELDSHGKIFAMINQKRFLIQYGSSDQINFYDIEQAKRIPAGNGIETKIGSFIRDIHVDSRDLIWIATNKGLWKLDVQNDTTEVLGPENGFSDERFTSISEDDQGILWLSTFLGGVNRYDPVSGKVEVYDEARGLSTNAALSVIPDNDGDIWVGTEYGINVIYQDHDLLHSIYKEDGLAYETFERFDPYKSRDGKLYFGSRNGISILDPGALKEYLGGDTTVRVYLTELSCFDQSRREEVTLESSLDHPGLLTLSPERPDIQVKFALSSYLEPGMNRFAYMLEGKDKDWQFIGPQHALTIGHLPAGRYNLLIKGADFRNNWTTTPIAIPIHRREFFYKQGWFFILIALPFMAFGLIWARNKQQESKRLEREVEARTQKIREDKEVIEKQAEELRELDEMKTRFFTNISHELRTPITLIRAPLEKLVYEEKDHLDNRLMGSLQLVLRNAGKLGKLVEELLDLGRLEANKAELNEVPTPVVPFCSHLFNAYAQGAALRKISYTMVPDLHEDEHMLLDRKRLEKIINNLLSNALKFTPEGGSVEMRVLRSAGDLLIEVKDTGRGIPEEDKPYLFDRYFQTRRKDISKEGGTGIGLALSRELAQLMNGDLSVESTWGNGSCFALRIPARKVQKPGKVTESFLQETTGAPAALSAVLPEATAPGQSRPKIMIVEDNEDMREMVYSLLADQYYCILKQNGAEAWRLLEQEDASIDGIELILSDVMMPEMDGYELLERIKRHPRWQRLPVVMLTARSAEEDKIQALRMGVDDYVLKPFSPNELTARLKNLLSNYRSRTEFLEAESTGKDPVEIEFGPAESAHQVWLKEVETAAIEGLDRGFKLTASFLADRVFLSERQFARRLKAVTGLTPNGYIQEIKLQKARHLLENQVYTTVNEVAQVCGYSSGSYLTKVYEQHFGKKPGEYL